MNPEPEWVETFLFHLRRTARNGRVNVQLSAELACIYRMRAYRMRLKPDGERLRREWDSAVEKARQVRLLHSR